MNKIISRRQNKIAPTIGKETILAQTRILLPSSSSLIFRAQELTTHLH
jgi:hypothetical protein